MQREEINVYAMCDGMYLPETSLFNICISCYRSCITNTGGLPMFPNASTFPCCLTNGEGMVELDSFIKNASDRIISWQGEKIFLMGTHDCLYDWKPWISQRRRLCRHRTAWTSCLSTLNSLVRGLASLQLSGHWNWRSTTCHCQPQLICAPALVASTPRKVQ